MFSHLEIDNYAVGIPLIIIVVGVFVIGHTLCGNIRSYCARCYGKV